jgi:hypothetical protein
LVWQAIRLPSLDGRAAACGELCPAAGRRIACPTNQFLLTGENAGFHLENGASPVGE